MWTEKWEKKTKVFAKRVREEEEEDEEEEVPRFEGTASNCAFSAKEDSKA
jgi:hypothetical protein